MIRLILTIYLSITILILNAQTFSITELEKLNTKNWDDFDTYVTNKGYQYNKDNETESYESKSYSFKQDANNNMAASFISFYKYTSNSNLFVSSVDFQTLNQQEYLKMKKQAKELGYKYIESNSHGTSTEFIYKKGKRKLSFIVGKNNNSNTWYEIDLTIMK